MTLFKPTKPSRRSGTSNWQFTRRIENKLHNRIAGHFIEVSLPAQGQDNALPVRVEMKPVISLSLGTKDSHVASSRCNRIDLELMRIIEIIKKGSISYTDEQIESFAHDVYRFYKERYVDTTGLPSEDKTLHTLASIPSEDLLKLAPILKKKHRNLQYYDIWEDTWRNGYSPEDKSSEAIEFRVGTLTNWWMFDADNRLTFEDRLRLIVKVDQIARYAMYNTLPTSSMSPTLKPGIAGNSDDSGYVSFETVLKTWESEQTRYETVKKRRLAFRSLQKSIGHDNANAVTKAQLLKWRAEIKEQYAPNTVNNVMIAGIKVVMNYAFDIGNIDKNNSASLKRVKDENSNAEGTPYTDNEVRSFVEAARSEEDPVIKYIVLLLVATGARFGEIAQLGSDQVHKGSDKEGMPNWLEIRPSSFGGKLKNNGSKRNIPLSSVLIESDFFQYVRERQGKPLFYDHKENSSRRYQQHNNLSTKTGPWIRSFPKKNPGVKTHHGFRHWLYTRAGYVRVRREYVNDFAGHAREGAQGRYGNRSKVIVLSEEMAPVFTLFQDEILDSH